MNSPPSKIASELQDDTRVTTAEPSARTHELVFPA